MSKSRRKANPNAQNRLRPWLLIVAVMGFCLSLAVGIALVCADQKLAAAGVIGVTVRALYQFLTTAAAKWT